MCVCVYVRARVRACVHASVPKPPLELTEKYKFTRDIEGTKHIIFSLHLNYSESTHTHPSSNARFLGLLPVCRALLLYADNVNLL